MNNNELLALARKDLACYATAVWPKFKLAAHHRLIADHLEEVERGDIRQLMISMPPRHGKSLLTAQIFPAWYLGRRPDRAIISASYGQELSDDFGRKVRDFAISPLHRSIFPECCLADAFSMRRFETTAGGSYYAVGRGGAITGRGADLLLIDDPLKDAEEANSDLIRHSLQEWFASVAYTRLHPGGAVILISTRWHQDDLAGWLLRQPQGGRWKVLSLPAIAEVDEGFRRAGDALWPEAFPLQELNGSATQLGVGLGHRFTNSVRRLRKGRSSEEIGGNSIVTSRLTNASCNPGTRPSRLGQRTTTPSAPPGR